MFVYFITTLPVKAVETNSEICLNSPFGKLLGGCTQRWQETGEVLMPEPTALRLRRLSPWAQVASFNLLKSELDMLGVAMYLFYKFSDNADMDG